MLNREYEIEYIYLAKQGNKPAKMSYFFDIFATDVTEARMKFHNEVKPVIEGEDSFIWIVDILELPV
jgi:hypothetical protein